ncbi:MAG: glycosyltransferase family 4 protein [SAR324 cluster bacterium]|nr:glycosyltransferase family 4 protein [SAR324 cluster bacterium]
MRIAQVAPLFESVPPKLYGGTERVISYLTDTLVNMGHKVTLYASADSSTLANLVPMCDRSLRLDPDCIDPLAHYVRMLERVFQDSRQFDIIHFHTDYLHFPLVRRHRVPTLTTLHGRLDIAELRPLYQEFSEMPLVSVSNSQRKPLPWVNWVGTVYHGLPFHLYPFQPRTGSYLAFLGRISPEKKVDSAIAVAKRVGMPLKIAAKVDRVDREYYQSIIRPLLDDPLIEYVGEIGEREKGSFLGNALALLFPIEWPEPFGLGMIEAMACGTPVIARRQGSVPEVVSHGTTGFICETQAEMVEAVERVAFLRRADIRSECELRFSATRMARDYLTVYDSLVNVKKIA